MEPGVDSRGWMEEGHISQRERKYKPPVRPVAMGIAAPHIEISGPLALSPIPQRFDDDLFHKSEICGKVNP